MITIESLIKDLQSDLEKHGNLEIGFVNIRYKNFDRVQKSIGFDFNDDSAEILKHIIPGTGAGQNMMNRRNFLKAIPVKTNKLLIRRSDVMYMHNTNYVDGIMRNMFEELKPFFKSHAMFIDNRTGRYVEALWFSN